MIKTQIYLTRRQCTELKVLSKALGKKQSELIREAIDRFLAKVGANQREMFIREAAVIWKDRTDSISANRIRNEWDRY